MHASLSLLFSFLEGPYWVPEYGSAENPGQFPYLYAYSPYHRVIDRTKYPSALFVTGDGDTRVAPWHARKMAARLQAGSGSGIPQGGTRLLGSLGKGGRGRFTLFHLRRRDCDLPGAQVSRYPGIGAASRQCYVGDRPLRPGRLPPLLRECHGQARRDEALRAEALKRTVPSLSTRLTPSAAPRPPSPSVSIKRISVRQAHSRSNKVRTGVFPYASNESVFRIAARSFSVAAEWD